MGDTGKGGVEVGVQVGTEQAVQVGEDIGVQVEENIYRSPVLGLR